MVERSRIGLYGGTFNPIHIAHLRVAQEIWSLCRLDKVVFVPSYNPPLKREGIVSFDDRVEMIRMAIEDNPRFLLSNAESKREGPSYTLLTLKDMKRQFYDSVLFFIIGIDAFLDLPNWHMPEKIVAATNLIVTTRPPWQLTNVLQSPFIETSEVELTSEDNDASSIELPLKGSNRLTLCRVTPLAISSTTIRELTRRGESIKYLLPENVESYIINKGLYKK
ncbi:MAG: nicotinate (nicotinamide) nucleotide adenylyltransferase [Nitrospirae bacterium]|nr:nicotinate (nicotinamide) nucleotide adenylyltransferase [Nitrospirota bacterium]